MHIFKSKCNLTPSIQHTGRFKTFVCIYASEKEQWSTSKPSPSLGLFTCNSLQGSLRPLRLTTLSFPLVDGGLSGEATGRGGAAEAGLKPRLQMLGPVEAGEEFQLLLRGFESWRKYTGIYLNCKFVVNDVTFILIIK